MYIYIKGYICICMWWQDLREQIDVLQEKVQKLKRAVKVYAKRLKANDGQ